MIKPIIVSCFTDELPDSGNLAGVFINQAIGDHEKQSIASTLKFPVTVFVLTSPCKVPVLEFFYPHRKMSLCLHGTLAAAYVLLIQAGVSQIKLSTADGVLLDIKRANSDVLEVKVQAESVVQPELSFGLVADLLNTEILNISKRNLMKVASIGSPKLLIPVDSSDVLARLKPNYAAIEKWSIENKVNGVYVYSLNSSLDTFYARGFNPVTGHHEDAATGTAAAALSSVLRRGFVIQQGQALHHPCRIQVRYTDQNEIWVGGRLVIKD